MKAHVENPSFLNAEKAKIYKIDHCSNEGTSSKKNISPPFPKKKSHKQVISFLNFSKNKLLHQQQNEPEMSFSTTIQNKKEEKFEFEEFDENPCNISQIGSQYGEKNYDYELKEVLKKQKRPLRKQYRTPKVMLRVTTEQKENVELPASKYQRFEKFQTQIQKKNSKVTEEDVVNYETYDLEGNSSKKMSGFCSQSHKFQHRNKTETHTKDEAFFTDTNTEVLKSEKTKKEEAEKIMGSENMTTKQIRLVDSTVSFQPLQFKREGHTISPSHRRSRTHEHVPMSDKQKSNDIFQNYHKLKRSFLKGAKNYRDQFFQDCLKATSPTNIQFCQKETKAQESHMKLSKENKMNYRSLPKCEPMALSENVYNFNSTASPTSRIVKTPKSLSRGNLDQQSLSKRIKERKKQYLQKTNGKPFDLSNFTFEQIKQKISKLEFNEVKRTQNKSHKSFAQRNVLLYSELFANCQKSKQQAQNEATRERKIKFKGIAFKANLIRKHTDIYEKHVRKMVDKNMSLKVTPKASQLPN